MDRRRASVCAAAEAGIIIGKTTTPEFGIKGTTDNTLTGITRNLGTSNEPQVDRPAAVRRRSRQGIRPLSIGTDGAGSDAHPGGVLWWFRAQTVIWPRTGVAAVAVRYRGAPQGRTRTVTDAAMLMNVISRPDARDWTSAI